jgi:hypothetical protein
MAISQWLGERSLDGTVNLIGSGGAFGPSVTAEYLGTTNPLVAAAVFASVMVLNPLGGPLAIRLRPKPTGSVTEHRAIVQAIREGDASEARERAKQHRARARDQLLPLLAEFGMRHL